MMAIDLIDGSKLTAYMNDLVYQGTKEPIEQHFNGEFESPDYVTQNRDTIIKGILKQYIQRRLRDYMTAIENEPAFVLVDRNNPDLPGWVENVFAKGKKVYDFDATKMSDKLRDEIITVRDYLYEIAGQYVDKVAETARKTKKKPKIRYDYLKTSNEYATFEMALDAARDWHEHLAENLAKLNKSKEMFQKSLVGAVHVMDLVDGMFAYQLTTPEALDFESEYMGHCVGKGSYDKGVKDGSIKIYSIRDERGEPHVTFEVRGNDIMQIKGKQNKPVVRKYIPAVQMFIEQTKLNPKHDLLNAGLIQQDGKLYNIYNLPKGFVVNGDLCLSNVGLEKLPDLSSVIVKGNFNCSGNQLTSLSSAPQSVGGTFDCSRNQLTSLSGAPQSVGGNFNCLGNQLTSLSGAPQSVGGDFNCSGNQLTSLSGAPQSVGGTFDCSGNQLTSLSGAPQSVDHDFDCSGNQLTSLSGAPQSVGGTFDCSDNQLTNLSSAPQSVGGTFDCSDNQLTNLSGAPQSVDGNFNCSRNQLTSLSGAPQSVSGDFYCSGNQLTNLSGAPQSVGDNFYCSGNQLTSLSGAPQSVGGTFDCSDNQLTNLSGAPQSVGGNFYCSGNQLTSLSGAPQSVGWDFYCSGNQLTSLSGAPQSVGGTFDCSDNQLTNLSGAPQSVGGTFDCSANQLTSLIGVPKELSTFLIVGRKSLKNIDSVMAPEYILDIASDLTSEDKGIMIQNYKKFKTKQFVNAEETIKSSQEKGKLKESVKSGKFKSFIRKILKKSDSMIVQDSGERD